MSIFRAFGPELVFWGSALVSVVALAVVAVKGAWRAAESFAAIRSSLERLHERMEATNEHLKQLNGQVIKNTRFREEQYVALVESTKRSAAATELALRRLEEMWQERHPGQVPPS